LTTPLALQAQAPIHRFNATIALQSTDEKFYSDVNTMLVKTGDGVERVVHVIKDSTVDVASASLDDLRPGKPVLVHYTVKGIQASAKEIDQPGPDRQKLNEGTVIRVDRHDKRVTIRFADGEMETLRLSKQSGSYVVVLYSNDSGQRSARYFKPER
jgi:hypothetical protein